MGKAGIRENLILGIDLGIGSCGWAIIDETRPSDRIVALGARTFDVPETDKERTPTNQLRRQHRGLRVVLRRRRQRMNDLRKLFRDAGLIPDDRKGALKIKGLNPWVLRAEGLDRKLTGEEFAVALGHIAKHRGFRSNSKRKSNEPASDDSKMLKEIEKTKERLKTYRSVGEMLARDPEFAVRKRNRGGDYTRSVLRDDQEREVRFLFDRQRAAGNRLATEELEQTFIDRSFSQKPLADSEDKVGECPFESGEKRAAKHSCSFELFRLLSRLTALRIQTGNGERPLSAEEIAAASTDFGGQKGMTFKRLRKILGLDDGLRFAGIPNEEEGKRDVVSRSGDMAAGTYALRETLGDAWRTLLAAPDKADRIAFVLSFREDINSIRKGLEDIGLEPLILDKLMEGVEAGDFGAFKGAGHISAKACRKIIPYLKTGLTYDRACAAAGYDHAKRPETDPSKIGNPVARKALTEAIKQVRAIVQEYGLPGHIHVELARDVGKSKEERDKITSGIEKRNKEKDKLRELFKQDVGQEPSSVEDLLRYELWREQCGRCIYTDQAINPKHVIASDNSVQVDHILPWSRSGDDSFINKALCTAKANQDKKGRTPFEWFRDEKTPDDWERFAQGIEANKNMKGRKKRNYTLRDASVLEEKFRPRNLNDTKYATRALLDILAHRFYPDDVRTIAKSEKEANQATENWFQDGETRGKVRVSSRPGQLTDRLRRGWGIQDLKKTLEPDGEKRRADDRHHAVDALIVAATSQAALMQLTRAVQEERKRGGHRDFRRLDPPWPGFMEETREKFERIFVSRAERRRARGEAHAATIKQVRAADEGKTLYEKRPVEKLTEKDLDKIPVPAPYGRAVNPQKLRDEMVESLRAWIKAGKPKDAPPLSPKGDIIRKVRVETKDKLAVLVRDGSADRGEMVRVDVFRKKNKKNAWEYFLVPIYPHQVADQQVWPSPPDRAVQAYKPEDEWPQVTKEHEFIWSLYPLSFVELEKGDGTFIDGYFRGLDRTTGAIGLSSQYSRAALLRGIGVKTLKSFAKFSVDRLGRRFPIPKETRTWHGEVCT